MACSKCILPEKFSNIEFDENHVCNYCNKYRTMCRYKGKDKLIEAIEKYRISGSKYDCVIPVSGGKDSIYALYYAKEILKLNPIAVNYNSGFQIPLATQNIENACKILDIPFIVKKDKYTGKLLRTNMRIGMVGGEDNSNGRGEGNLRFCNNCESLLRAVAIHTAKKYNSGIIFWGSHSIEDEMSNKLMDIFYRRSGNKRKVSLKTVIGNHISAMKSKFFRKNGKTFVRIFEWNLPITHFYLAIIYQFWSIIQKLSMNVPARIALSSRGKVAFTESKPKFILLYDYVDFFYYEGGTDSIKGNVELLRNKLKWEFPIGKESRFDCEIHSFSNYFFIQKNGVSMDGARLCNHIREGHMTRDEVYEREEALVENLLDECKSVLHKIDMTKYTIKYFESNGGLKQNECMEKSIK